MVITDHHCTDDILKVTGTNTHLNSNKHQKLLNKVTWNKIEDNKKVNTIFDGIVATLALAEKHSTRKQASIKKES